MVALCLKGSAAIHLLAVSTVKFFISFNFIASGNMDWENFIKLELVNSTHIWLFLNNNCAIAEISCLEKTEEQWVNSLILGISFFPTFLMNRLNGLIFRRYKHRNRKNEASINKQQARITMTMKKYLFPLII